MTYSIVKKYFFLVRHNPISAYQKFSVDSRAAAVAVAAQKGLLG